MTLLLVLIVLSIITYVVVQRSISNITKTPVWLCWLVMMFPAFLWTGWVYVVGDEEPIPILLLLIPLVVCPLLYGWLIQKGKITSKESPAAKKEPSLTKPELPVAAARPISNEEETTLRNCFPWNIYYLQNIDYRPQAVLCRGKLKTVPEEAYQKIKKNVEGAFGDRFFLIFQESLRGQPFFALVPNPQAKEKNSHPEQLTRPGLALFLLVVTLLTTTVAGVEFTGFDLEQIQSQPEIFIQGLLYSIPLLLIIGIHELAHYWATVTYHIRCSLPYMIPLPFFIGTLGAFVQKRSPLPHRQALFDTAISGSMAGFVLTLPFLFWGLSQSQAVPLDVDETNLFNFEALDPRLSFLVAIAAKVALGSQLEPGMAINLHSTAIAAYIGLLFVAFNLMPVGQLNGGHIVHAVFGQRMAIAIGQIARILAILFALVHTSFWVWTIILWFMPLLDRPALNDITELNNWRDFCGLLALALLLLIILPLPAPVANLLNI